MATEGGCMRLCKRLIILILLFIGVVTSGSVFANGINPPRPKGNSTATAICIERPTQRKHELIRAVIKSSDEISKMLKYHMGDVTNQILITDIKLLILSADVADPDGFVKAILVRRGTIKEESLKIQIKSEGNNISLQGYGKDGSKLSIALSECEKIEFSSDTSDTYDTQPPAKK